MSATPKGSDAPPPKAPAHSAQGTEAPDSSDRPRARRYQVIFDQSFVDPDVRKVVKRLVRAGHEAYLVGGCVRDLLLGRKPKDFDVATSATPEEVRAQFRNSRIIGRRFRLVHVMFHGGKVFEVATFRRNPRPGDTDTVMIRSDNVFGEAHEDAARRDFTINGLFYDVETSHIHDWVGGVQDIQKRLVRTIGEPVQRIREDPVRLLRAIKFAGRCDLGLAPELYDAIVYCRELVTEAARPRVAEEILRLLRGGEARRSIYIAWEMGVLDVLLPELSALLYDAEGDGTPGARVWRQLGYIDERVNAGDTLDDTVLWTLLLLEPMKEAADGQRDRAKAVAGFLDDQISNLAITRRSADGMRRIVAALPKVQAGKPGRMQRSETFRLLLDVATADLRSRGEATDVIDAMRADLPPPGDRPPSGRARRGRRRGRRRNRPSTAPEGD